MSFKQAALRITCIGFAAVFICSIGANIYLGLGLRSARSQLADCRKSVEQLQLDNTRLEQKVGLLKQYNSEFGTGLEQLKQSNNSAIGTIEGCRQQLKQIRKQVKVLEDCYNRSVSVIDSDNHNDSAGQ